MKAISLFRVATLTVTGCLVNGALQAESVREITTRDELADAVLLGDGDALKLGSTAFAPTIGKPLVGWAEDFGRWTVNGVALADATLYHQSAWPYQPKVVGNDLIVTDDGAQRQTVVYNDSFRAVDRWQANFTLSLELPADSKYVTEGWGQVYANTFFIGLQPYGTTNRVDSTGTAPGSYGFVVRPWSTYRDIRRVDNGVIAAESILDGTSIDVCRPMNITLACTNRVLTFTVEQDERRMSVATDVSAAYGENGAFLMFGAKTDWWGWKVTMPWMYSRLSNFEGSVERTDPATLAEDSAGYPSGTQWKCFGTSEVSKGVIKLISPKSTAQGGALCRKLFKVGLPLSFECDLGFGKSAAAGQYANGMSIVLQPGSNGLTMTAGGLNYIPANAIGVCWGYYANQVAWVSGGQKVGESASGVIREPDVSCKVKLDYDGVDCLTLTLTQGDTTVSRSRLFPEMRSWGSAYVGVWGAAAQTWDCYLESTLSNVVVRTPSAAIYKGVSVGGDLTVGDGSSSSLVIDPVPGTMMYSTDDAFSFSDDFWVRAGNAAWTGDPVRLHMTESWTSPRPAATVLAKKPISSTRPFRVAYTVQTGTAHANGQAQGISLCFKPVSTGCSLPLSNYTSQPDAATQSFGFVINYYDSKVGWHEQGERKEMEEVPFAITVNSLYDVVVTHDGLGTLTAVITSGGKTFVTSHFFQQLKDMGEDMYVGLSAAVSNWNAAMVTDVTAFSFEYVTTGVIPSDHVAAAIDALTLGDGATLAIGSSLGTSAASLRNLSVSGSAAMPLSGLQLSVGRLSFVGGTSSMLTLSGAAVAFADPFEIVIPAAWRSAFVSEKRVVAFDAVSVPSLPQAVNVRFADGTSCKITAKVCADGISLLKPGMVIMVR